MIWKSYRINKIIIDKAYKKLKNKYPNLTKKLMKTAFSNKYYKLNKDVVGAVGEAVVEQYFKNNKIKYKTDKSGYDMYDFILNRNIIIDVKTTQRRVPPRINYEVEVMSSKIERQWYSNILVFVWIQNTTKAWILGWLSRNTFDAIKEIKEGLVRGIEFQPCWAVEIRKLVPIDNLKNYLKI